MEITKLFQNLKQKNQGVFIAGMVPGYPDLKTSFKIAQTIINAGADVLELSSSFSDPIADGPTIQQAHAHVLKNKINKNQIFELYKKIHNFSPNTPLFIIEYINCVYCLGINNYYKKLATSGVDNLLIPDLSIEEAKPFLNAAKKYKINQIFIVAPTTTKNRLIKINKFSSKFLYLVAVAGVTGKRENFLEETKKFIQETKKIVSLPIIIGFGISKQQHVFQALSAGANGIVICSANINLIKKNLNDKKKMLNELKIYIKNIKNATLI
ncbi:MAG: tryptophan synthase subunit alpha [Candidatus Kuenenbacteria bacterium]